MPELTLTGFTVSEGLLVEVGDLGGCQFGFDESELDLLTVGGTTCVNWLCIDKVRVKEKTYVSYMWVSVQ